jgi:hypothetical protein
MYLWNVSALASELKANTISEYEKTKYYILYSAFLCFILAVPNVTEYPAALQFLRFSLDLLITVLGIVYVFKINEQGDNQDFIARSLCIGVPLSFKIIVLFLTIYIMAHYFLDNILQIKNTYIDYVVEIILEILAALYYYYSLGYWLKEISKD